MDGCVSLYFIEINQNHVGKYTSSMDPIPGPLKSISLYLPLKVTTQM